MTLTKLVYSILIFLIFEKSRSPDTKSFIERVYVLCGKIEFFVNQLLNYRR
ncbi:hypothetical protein M2273_003064 [Mucilaginibacter lappiensis]|jgi:hypothetical protein